MIGNSKYYEWKHFLQFSVKHPKCLLDLDTRFVSLLNNHLYPVLTCNNDTLQPKNTHHGILLFNAGIIMCDEEEAIADMVHMGLSHDNYQYLLNKLKSRNAACYPSLNRVKDAKKPRSYVRINGLSCIMYNI